MVEITQPLPPQTVQDTHLPKGLLRGLALKLLVIEGGLNVLELAERLCLSLPVTEELGHTLRKELLCEVKGQADLYYRLAPTDLGRAQAAELLSRNQYVGPAPVSLSEYDARVQSQSVQQAKVTQADLSRALQGLVLGPDIMARVGSATVSGTSLFLYGPAGTGKTSIATRLRLIYRDAVWIPYAVEADGQIVTVYDPATHRKATQASVGDGEGDKRWVLCERPCILADGQFSREMLELQFDPVRQFYSAPLQMRANNGLLVVDDFGRQGISLEALLD